MTKPAKKTPVRERLLATMKPGQWYFPESIAKTIKTSTLSADGSLMAMEREKLVKGELRIHTVNNGTGRLRYKRAYSKVAA